MLLGLAVVAVVAATLSVCLVCANPYEPRLDGKARVLARLDASERGRAHVLPFAHANTLDEVRVAAARIGYPVVIKPNALTSCALGVHKATSEREVDTLTRKLMPLLFDGSKDDWRGVVVQQYYGPASDEAASTLGTCIEARIYGVRRPSASAWQWDPIVFAPAPAARAAVERAPMSRALQTEVEAVMSAAFPDMYAVAMDVRAPSLAALQEHATFHILEVNGAFGVAHTWRGHDSFVVSMGHMALDLLRWVGPRFVSGASNIVRGRVNVGARVQQEWAWAWTANRVLKRIRTHFAGDEAELI